MEIYNIDAEAARDDINNFIPKAKSRISEIVLFINGK